MILNYYFTHKESQEYEQSGDRHIEGNSAAHLRASPVGTSQTVIIHNGKLLLGTRDLIL